MPPIQPDADNKHAIELKFRSFESQVLYFNSMYKLPAPNYPTPFVVIQNERAKLELQAENEDEHTQIRSAHAVDILTKRLWDFKKTLNKELQEVDDIINKLAKTKTSEVGEDVYPLEDFLTDMADWLGDIQVYCASEMVKFGLPNNDILQIIMQSNFSKLQADGSTKYDANGKVEKGPLYWKPEPRIKELILELQKAAGK